MVGTGGAWWACKGHGGRVRAIVGVQGAGWAGGAWCLCKGHGGRARGMEGMQEP